MLVVNSQIFTLRELDTRREFTANHDAVLLSSLTPDCLPAVAPSLKNANNLVFPSTRRWSPSAVIYAVFDAVSFIVSITSNL